MGFINDDVGTIAIEERSESFIIHAGYGYVPGRRKLRELKLGDEFEAADDTGGTRRWRVHMLTEDIVAGRETQFSAVKEWPADAEVVVPGYEEDAPGPFAARWRQGHPEFLYRDLDDLIIALQHIQGKQPT